VDPGDPERVLEQFRDVQEAWDRLHGADANAEASLGEGGSTGAGTGAGASGGRPPATSAPLGAVRSRPELTTVLITHYHWDHAGGNKVLHARAPELRIVGSQREAVPYANAVATHGAKLWLGRTEIDVIAAGCHTRGHVMYHVHGAAARRSATIVPADGSEVGGGERGFAGAGAVVTGATLFVGGAGKVCGGTAVDMPGVGCARPRALRPARPVLPRHA